MKVLIVAKTRMRLSACVGGLVLDENRNVRLLGSNGASPPMDTPYDVGEIWDLQFRRKRYVIAPHVEDVEVISAQKLGRVPELRTFLLTKVRPWYGAPEQLFDGMLQFTSHGAGYVALAGPIPDGSVGFWQSAADLRAEVDGGRTRYRYASRFQSALIPYVGFATPEPVVPEGSLLRVSLARWWKPDDAADVDKRCYLQLSGWYAAVEPAHAALPPERSTQLPVQKPTTAYSFAQIRKEYNKAYAPWTKIEDDYLRVRFLEGATLEELVSEFGRKPGGIKSRLRRLGLDAGKIGAEVPAWRKERPRAGHAWTAEEDAALLRDIHAGMPLEVIARTLGRGRFAVEVRLHKLGIWSAKEHPRE